MIMLIIITFLCIGIGYVLGINQNSPQDKMDQKTAVLVKLRSLSNDPKEIENFLIQFTGAGKLDQNSIDLLISRIEEIKADKIISNESAAEISLKQRIDILNPVFPLEELEFFRKKK